MYWIDGNQQFKAEDRAVGPSVALKVKPGDKIALKTWARYEEHEDYTSDVTLALFAQFLGTDLATMPGLDGLPVSNPTGVFESALAGLPGEGEDATPAGLEELQDSVEITTNGYIYVWVSNGSEATKVWFDDLTVVHTGGVVTQATDYGVWGDVLSEEKLEDAKYRLGYQGHYAEKDEETGWNHFELREYDPIIGRWLVPDPMGQHWSPYSAMGNNPLFNIDPTGGVDGPGDTCPECAGLGPMLPEVVVSSFEFDLQDMLSGYVEAEKATYREQAGKFFMGYPDAVYQRGANRALEAATRPRMAPGNIEMFNIEVDIALAITTAGMGNTAERAFAVAVESAVAERIGKRGFLEVGYQFQKHFARGGSWKNIIPRGVTLNPKTFNDAGYRTFMEIWNAPGTFRKVGGFIEKRLADGRGIRLRENWEFKGFLD